MITSDELSFFLKGNKIQPGRWFKSALEFINDAKYTLPENGQEILDHVDSIRPKYIEQHAEAKQYFKNIRPNSPLEEKNLMDVTKAMDSLMKIPTVVSGSVMPDACPTGENQIPVGGVVIAKNAIHPSMHSADICCSVMMSNLGDANPKDVLDWAMKVTHFGSEIRKGELYELPKQLEQDIVNNEFFSTRAIYLSKVHLGTQGDGNHFLFVGQSKRTGETMLVTHHGSRGFGANLYKKGMEVAEKFRRALSPSTSEKNAWIPYDTPEGESYWEALQIVREWTRLNHRVIHQKIASEMGMTIKDWFWNEHNFVFKRDDLFYHAKGATPLLDEFVPDNSHGLRLIPLNMSQPVLIVRGEESTNNLGFAPHGAGRNLSRSQHKETKKGLTEKEVFEQETQNLDVRFYSGNIDISELPSAYKDAQSVREQMQEFGLGQVVDEILPYGSIMAGNQASDAPWRRAKQEKREGRVVGPGVRK